MLLLLCKPIFDDYMQKAVQLSELTTRYIERGLLVIEGQEELVKLQIELVRHQTLLVKVQIREAEAKIINMGFHNELMIEKKKHYEFLQAVNLHHWFTG